MMKMDAASSGPSDDLARRQADELNRRIVDSSEDCLKILTLDGRIDYVNRAGVGHMDLSCAEEMLGRPWLDFWEPEDRQAASAALECALSEGRGTFQGLSRTASGKLKSWDVVVTPIMDAAGRPVQLLAVARDRTERRHEEAFRAGQQALLEMIATGAALDRVLDRLVRLLEQHCEGTLCSVLLLDSDGMRLRHGAAPNLPPEYVQAIDGLMIGPRAGCCGTAVYRGDRVIVTDVLTDPARGGRRRPPAPGADPSQSGRAARRAHRSHRP